ncbi:MAG: hypothetical protein ACRC0A_07700 [Chitinophagaceae bacterium]
MKKVYEEMDNETLNAVLQNLEFELTLINPNLDFEKDQYCFFVERIKIIREVLDERSR